MPTDDAGKHLRGDPFTEYRLGWETRRYEYGHSRQNYFYAALGCVAAGLLAWFVNFVLLTVGFFASAVFFARFAMHCHLMEDVMQEHWHLAKLITAQGGGSAPSGS